MIKYLSRNYRNTTSAGNKAKTDIESIMDGLGYRNAGLPQSHLHNTVGAFLRTLGSVLRSPFSLRRGDILVLQYPLKKYYEAVCDLAHMRGAKVVTLIHDLGSFRRKALTPEREIRRLNHSDYVIAHNESMRRWLADHGCKAQLGTLGIFDYLSATSAPAEHTPGHPYRVAYAGSLNRRKNTFLYNVGKYISGYELCLFGNGFEPEHAEGAEHIRAMGFRKSDDLIAAPEADFGLVWDGQSVDRCDGDFGEYLKFNNPHKTSFYIRCGLPVIIWSRAALAPFVREKGIGLTVDSLADLDAALAAVTPEDYARMRANVMALSAQLAAGYYAATALTVAAEAIRAAGNR